MCCFALKDRPSLSFWCYELATALKFSYRFFFFYHLLFRAKVPRIFWNSSSFNKINSLFSDFNVLQFLIFALYNAIEMEKYCNWNACTKTSCCTLVARISTTFKAKVNILIFGNSSCFSALVWSILTLCVLIAFVGIFLLGSNQWFLNGFSLFPSDAAQL